MDLKSIFLIISTIVGLITPIIGIRAIFKGEYKPHRTTRLIFLIVTSLFVLTLLAQGDRVGIILAIIQLISSTAIFILSFKYGVGGTSKTDIVVFVSAMITLLIWRLTDNPTLALYMSILTDIIGFAPTLVKSFKEPYTEDPKFYGSDTVAGTFNILALRSYNLSDLAFPGYIFLVNFASVLLILIGRKSKNPTLKK